MQNQTLTILTSEQTTDVIGGCVYPMPTRYRISPPREPITPAPGKGDSPVVITLALGEHGGDWKSFM